ncbi:hypothetical protein [Nocardioides daeguensis]|uniref:Alpha/beta hydrolase n=1 Tax=Nocardioides daeguensis TaxID=908359 RepID=A0ABP6VIK2_9ACTN|nr:hypothetical protein [Nocardioides daeguensis]MBV6729535.1 hypothetical protein [Nocardioides daeguensis]MCR1771692.1 hypothetical protein [Nocardioides daeguensis]
MGDDGGGIVSVTGGAGGIEARYEDIETLARLFDDTGDGLRSWAWDDKGIAADGDLVESSVLSPLTFTTAEAAVLKATIGPGGLAFEAVDLELDALAMQANVVILRGVDDLQRQAVELLDYLVGRTIGALGPSVLLLGALTLATSPGLALLAYLNRDELATMSQEQLIALLEEHPEVVQHLLNGGGGLVDGLLDNLPPVVRDALLAQLGLDPLHPTTNDIAGDLAALFEDTDVSVTEGGAAGEEARSLAAPGSIEELIRNLDKTNSGADGEIDIVRIEDENGVRYIVNLPGTDDFGVGGAAVRDTLANLQLVGGEETAYARGIREAMESAGIPPGAPVALVGHSQGGMTAVQLAGNPEFTDRFNVQHVVTAGAPTAQVSHLPDSIQALSLENTGDLVPLTDGEDNPDQPNRTTVRFDHPTGSVGGNHALDTYAVGAGLVDDSTDPSLVETLQQLRQDGFVGSDGTTTTSTYTIARTP